MDDTEKIYEYVFDLFHFINTIGLFQVLPGKTSQTKFRRLW